MEKDKKIKLILNIVKGKSGEEDQKYFLLYEIINGEKILMEKIELEPGKNTEMIKINNIEITIIDTGAPLATNEDEIIE